MEAADDKIDICAFFFLHRRVHDEVSINTGDPHFRNRTLKRNIRYCKAADAAKAASESGNAFSSPEIK